MEFRLADTDKMYYDAPGEEEFNLYEHEVWIS
jgi:hypothetical protein